MSGLAGAGWRGEGKEYSCQSTANCLDHSNNNNNISNNNIRSAHCEGVRSSTLLTMEYGPENIRVSHQVIGVRIKLCLEQIFYCQKASKAALVLQCCANLSDFLEK